MFHSSALWLLRLYDYSTVVALVVFFLLFSFCLFVSCVPLFLYKMIFFLLQCVSQSVCLSLSMWPSSWLSGCRWKSGVTQWATSSGGFVRGDALPLVPRGPNRRGSCTAAFILSLLRLCVSQCVMNVFSCLRSRKDVICEVGEVFLPPCSLFYFLSNSKWRLLLVFLLY